MLNFLLAAVEFCRIFRKIDLRLLGSFTASSIETEVTPSL